MSESEDKRFFDSVFEMGKYAGGLEEKSSSMEQRVHDAEDMLQESEAKVAQLETIIRIYEEGLDRIYLACKGDERELVRNCREEVEELRRQSDF